MREYVKAHKEIHNAIYELSGQELKAVSITDVAKKVGMDIRTVENHLAICEIDGFGILISKNLFIMKKGIMKMARELKINIDD